MPSMPKLYLGPGLSQRVHQALTRRLERFMANTALPAASEFPISENPPLPAQAGAVDLESEKEEEQGITHPEEGNKSRQTKRREMMTDQGLPDQGSLSQTLMTRQASWPLPRPWPSGSRQ
jgi:hypothetical protein